MNNWKTWTVLGSLLTVTLGSIGFSLIGSVSVLQVEKGGHSNLVIGSQQNVEPPGPVTDQAKALGVHEQAIADALKRRDALNQEVEEKKTAVRAEEARIRELSAEYGEAKASSQRVKDAWDQAQATIAAQQKQISGLQTQLSASLRESGQVIDLRSALDRQKTTFQETLDKLNALNDENSALKSKADEDKTTIEELTAERDSLQSQELSVTYEFLTGMSQEEFDRLKRLVECRENNDESCDENDQPVIQELTDESDRTLRQ